MNETIVPTMLSIRETARRCNVAEGFIRRLVREGAIVYVMAGSRVLINLEKFVDYLNGVQA